MLGIVRVGPPLPVAAPLLKGGAAVYGAPMDQALLYVPDWPTIVAFVSATVLLAITPGPDMTLFLGRTLAQGRAAGLAVIAGTTTGCLMHTMLAALGVSALVKASPTGFLVLKIVGAGYLAWLAVQALRHGTTFELNVRQQRRSFWADYARGWAVNALNPKIAIFFVTFLPHFVSRADPHVAGKLVFLGVLFALVALPIMVPMVFGAERLTDFLRRSPKVLRGVDYVFAGVFGAFAASILATQR